MTSPTPPGDVFQGGGEMGAAIRAFDWTATPLGAPQTWPHSLQAIVRMMLTSRQPMWMAWGEDLIFFCNDACLPALGAKRPRSMGQSARRVWAKIWPEISPAIDQVLTTGEAVYSEGVRLSPRSSGSRKAAHHAFSFSPLFDDDGAIAGVVCVVAQETDEASNARRLDALRRDAARALMQSEQKVLVNQERLELALATGRIAIFEYDGQAHSVTMLGPLTAAFGVDVRRAAEGLPLEAFIEGLDEPDRPRMLDMVRGAIAGGQTYDVAFRLVGADEPRSVVSRGSVQAGADGRTRIVGAVIDISEEKQAQALLREQTSALESLNLAAQREIDQRRATEAALQALNTQLGERVAAEVAERMKVEETLRQAQKMEAVGQLTGGVAHDFNNLLTVIIGGLETIRRNAPSGDARLARALDMGSQGANSAATLTARLLAFSRRQPLDPRPLDLNAVVRQSTELLHRTLGETIELEGVLAARLWLVEADQNQLENAILNLAVNARDAMAQGGKLTIETANTLLDESYVATDTEVAPGQYAMLSISDSGSGMSRQVLERAFEPFYTTKAVGKGTGLGLSMVYGFVKQSGGHVAIYSEPGEGTTVKLYFPRYAGDLAGGVAAVRASAPEGVSGETVLLVEDNDEVRAYSASVLTELGYQVLEAADAETALAIARQPGRVDLLFTDVVLPGRSGRQLADEALTIRPDLKVLYTTGYSRDAIVHQGRLDPGVNLISKPFTFEQLAQRLRDVLDG